VKAFLKKAKSRYNKVGIKAMRLTGKELAGAVVQPCEEHGDFWKYEVYVDAHKWASRKYYNNLMDNRLSHFAAGWGWSKTDDGGDGMFLYDTEQVPMLEIGYQQFPHSTDTMKVPKREFHNYMGDHYNRVVRARGEYRMILCTRKIDQSPGFVGGCRVRILSRRGVEQPVLGYIVLR
jgi:hypothetical protein